MKKTKEENKKSKISIKELKPYLKYYKGYKKSYFGIIIFAIISIIIGIFTPIYSGKLLASFTTNFVLKLTFQIALSLFILRFLDIIVSSISRIIYIHINSSIEHKLRYDIINRIDKIKVSCFDKVGAYEITSRLKGDTYAISSFLQDIIHPLYTLLTSIGFTIYIFMLNYSVAIVLIIFGLATYFFENLRIKYWQKVRVKQRTLKDTSGNLENEFVKAIKDVKSLDIAENIENKIFELESEYIAFVKNKTLKNVLLNLLGSFIDIFTRLLFIIYIAFLVSKNKIDITTAIIAYNSYYHVYILSSTISRVKENLSTVLISANKLNDLYDENKFGKEIFGSVDIDNFSGEIEFKNVNFEYESDIPVLRNVSFSIKENTFISLVGKSGCGKTTIVSLIDKLYTLKENDGEILISNHNINEISKNCLRNNITVVSQSPYLFNITIKENLQLVNPSITDEKIWNVLKDCEMYDFVYSQPNKLDTKLGENGIKLSGGQKQRLAIARAIIKNSKIIIFDEATSALDNDNQQKIKKTIKNLTGKHTIIFIAHRLSTVIDSNEIFFIEDGNIKAKGTHKYLMENCEEYRNLYNEEC